MNNTKPRILFIASGPASPGTSIENNPFAHLSKYLQGDVLGSTWNSPTYKKYIDEIQHSFVNFKYNAFKRSELPSFLRALIHFANYLYLGRKIIKNNRPDVIISYGFLVPGIIGALLSKIYNIPFIVEIPGVPGKALKYSEITYKSLALKIMELSANFACKQATCVWMLFPDQYKNKKVLSSKKIFIFHEFTAVSIPKPTKVSENIISFLGYPWKLKGVDILIKSFNIVNKKFPDAKLKIAGYCPDKSEFEKLAAPNSNNISFVNSMDHKEAMKFVENCKIFVLPSRTEAMGRVLLEAMAAEKAIVASNVDGIPHYLEDNKTGLLFESENVEDLSIKLEKLLSDQELIKTLGANARKSIFEKYSEEIFAKKFIEMINYCLKCNE